MAVVVMRVSDFEWASFSRYMEWVSVYIGLDDINWGNVYTFPYGRLGPDKLKARKVRLLSQIIGDIEKIDDYISEISDELGPPEQVALNSMKDQYASYRDLLEDHLGRIEVFRKVMSNEFTYEPIKDEVTTNDVPF